MAKWESVQLADNPTLKDIADAANNAITQVNVGLDVVKSSAEFAKNFLFLVVDPIAAGLLLTANSLIASLQNFQEAGMYVLIIDPFEPHGMKNRNAIGLEMVTENGMIVFEKSRVINPSVPFGIFGATFEVNESYRKSVSLVDLNSTYRDSNGRTKADAGFIPPIPVLSESMALVEGGYDPATWTGNRPSVLKRDFGFGLSLPEFPADKCIEMMAAAFEDPGDVPRYKIKDSLDTSKYYTYSGNEYTVKDKYAYVNQELYRLPPKDRQGNQLTTIERFPVTTRISSGKPNYQGNTELLGVKVTAVAIIVAASNPKEWADEVLKIKNLFSGFSEFWEKMEEFSKQFVELYAPTERVRIRASSKYSTGLFKEGDLVKGKNGSAIGKIKTIYSSELSDMKITEYSHNGLRATHHQDAVVPTKIITKIIDKNKNGEFYDMDIEIYNYTSASPNTNIKVFQTDEVLLEAEEYEIPNPEGDYVKQYKEKYEQDKINALFGGRVVSDSRKPKYGTVLGSYPAIPPSTLPDFTSMKLGDHIDGYTDVFDSLINVAEILKSFAESSLAAIQLIIDAIDDIIEFFEEIAENIIKILELFKTGLPNAGVYYLGMTSQNGSQAFANAIRSSDVPKSLQAKGGFETLKISAGFCFVGDPITSSTGTDPVKLLFEALGLKLQSVS